MNFFFPEGRMIAACVSAVSPESMHVVGIS